MSSSDEKWATLANKFDDGDDVQVRSSKQTAEKDDADDEDEDHKNNKLVTNGRIHLKTIPKSELESITLNRRRRRGRGRSMRFITDATSELSNDQIKSQLNNTADTLVKDHIPETLKVGKPSDKFEKLVKRPERSLSSTLELYYAKNLVRKRSSPDDRFNDFDISIDEIQSDVDRATALRNYRSNPAKYPRPAELKERIKNEDTDEDYANFSFSDFKRKAVKPVTAIKSSPSSLGGSGTISTANSNHITVQLGKIDGNFKPTISLGTRTYTRTRRKDLPSKEEVRQAEMDS